MAAVTKCDICGTIYNNYRTPGKSFKIDVTEYCERTDDHYYSSIDCCPECTNKMLEFIDVLKSGRNYVIYVDDADLLEKE